MSFFLAEMRCKGWCVYGLVQIGPDLTRRRTRKTGQKCFVSRSEFSDHRIQRIARILRCERGTQTDILQKPLHSCLRGRRPDFLGLSWDETCSLSSEPRARVTLIRMASRAAVTLRSGDQVWICASALPATDLRRVRSVSTPFRIYASVSTSPHGKMKCGATGTTRSCAEPT